MIKKNDNKKKIKIIVLSIIFLVVLGFIAYFSFNFKFCLVSGNSMNPTLNNHSLILLKKQNKKSIYENGDIVVCKVNDELVVKRIVASEGDTISYITNQMYINDVYYGDVNSFGMSPTTLSENEFAIIGDNYNNSTDSRYYGYILKENIIGEVVSYQNWFSNVYNFFIE